MEVNLLPDGRVELRQAKAFRDASSVFGILRRDGRKTATIAEMQEAIEAGACGE